jgi:hypothetical protein
MRQRMQMHTTRLLLRCYMLPLQQQRSSSKL